LGILDQDPLEALNAQVAQLRNDTQDLRSANIRSSSAFTKNVTDLFLSLFHSDSTTTDTTTAKVVTPYWYVEQYRGDHYGTDYDDKMWGTHVADITFKLPSASGEVQLHGIFGQSIRMRMRIHNSGAARQVRWGLGLMRATTGLALNAQVRVDGVAVPPAIGGPPVIPTLSITFGNIAAAIYPFASGAPPNDQFLTLIGDHTTEIGIYAKFEGTTDHRHLAFFMDAIDGEQTTFVEFDPGASAKMASTTPGAVRGITAVRR
jgi:hypothetical protein